ncbi:MAG: hypothetical protein B6242_03115 [Anaerolineaceae bacterium 4572_78]|nr:MAG: hypothetical protein B6242_03115 [Anaerolineaceae bacterium 4572_78]
MKVLAINGSPRMKASSTYHMLTPFLEGIESAGAETDIIHVHRLDLKPCIGCFTCWKKTPGICIHDDAMADAIQKYNPLYVFTMSGTMKTFIDRLVPRMEPWLIPHPDFPHLTFHPERFDKPRKMFLVSPCGFPELEHFDSLVYTFKHIARITRMEYLGEILRPYGDPMSSRALQNLFTDYYELLRQAGVELIRDGGISDDMQEKLRKDLFPVDKKALYQMANEFWTRQMDKFNVPDELRHTVPISGEDSDSTPIVPESSKPGASKLALTNISNEFMMNAMADMYQPNVIPNLHAVVQLHFVPPKDGLETGSPDWYLDINEATCTVHQGQTPFPTLTISTTYELWRDIGLGKIDPVESFTNGDYEVNGVMQLLDKFPQIFAYPKSDVKTILNQSQSSKKSEVIMTKLSFHDIIKGMPTAFNSQVAGDMDAVIQFHGTGEEPGDYYLHIANGKCTFYEGISDSVNLTIHTPSEVWVAISMGEIDGQQAFMQGKYRAEGDFSILMKMTKLFKSL